MLKIFSHSKTCACCGKVYQSRPKHAVKDELGYFFNCECNSTLFWNLTPFDQLIQKIKTANLLG